MSAPVVLDLLEPGDSAADVKIITTLQGLVDGLLEPRAAAETIDAEIVRDCQEAYVSYTSVPSPSPEQLENKTIRAPQPAGWIKFLWDCVGKAAMKVPANHAGQDRLVSLLYELQQLPKHRVPWLAAGNLIEKELWSLNAKNGYEGLNQWLWELDQGHFTGGRQVEQDPAAALEYVNYSAFLARLLAKGVAEVTRLSALTLRSPFHRSFPSLAKTDIDSAEAVRHYEPYACAAAQWMIFAAEALCEMCNEGVLVAIGEQRWTQGLWDARKTNFEYVARDERFSEQARDYAAQAAERMVQAENHDFGKAEESIIQKFGFITPEKD
ncbi:hypothetical protein Hte_012030 [Hypoxylon texense]